MVKVTGEYANVPGRTSQVDAERVEAMKLAVLKVNCARRQDRLRPE